MTIILDKSIWIEYLKGNSNYFEQCQLLLEQGNILTIDFIFAELLQGALNERETSIIKAYYDSVHKLPINDIVLAAGDYSRDQKLISKGIGLIDSCIIVSTIKSESKLWTLDKKIKNFLPREYLFDV